METILTVILVSTVVSSCICLLFFLMLRSKLEEYLSLANKAAMNCLRGVRAMKGKNPNSLF